MHVNASRKPRPSGRGVITLDSDDDRKKLFDAVISYSPHITFRKQIEQEYKEQLQAMRETYKLMQI